MPNIKVLAAYFFGGILYDFILTLYYRAIYAKMVVGATILAAVLTFVAQFVIYNIVEQGGGRKNKILLISIYAVGNGVGTLFAMAM